MNWLKKIKKIPALSTLIKLRHLPKQFENTLRQQQWAAIAPYSLQALNRTESGIHPSKRPQQLIISLTTYNLRIDNVYLVIESLMQQTIKADKIILWLSEDEFSSENLPEILKQQQKQGLTIGFCEDLGSYKKLIPTLEQYPEALIITADDDVIYPINHIEKLYDAYIKEPEFIHCQRGHLIKLDTDGKVKPYKQWQLSSTYTEVSELIFPTTGAGVLFFPGCFDDEVFNNKLFQKICQNTDDIWFKIMAHRKGIKSKIVANGIKWEDYLVIPSTIENGLWKQNRTNNDKHLKAILKAYPDVKFQNLLQ